MRGFCHRTFSMAHSRGVIFKLSFTIFIVALSGGDQRHPSDQDVRAGRPHLGFGIEVFAVRSSDGELREEPASRSVV